MQNHVWMDVIKFFMLIGSTFHASSSFILFYFRPRMVSDKNTRRNIFTIMFLCSLHKGITAKSESSWYLPKVLALGQKLILGKPLIFTQVGEVVSPPTSTYVCLSQDSC
jgi:hypothetical protein